MTRTVRNRLRSCTHSIRLPGALASSLVIDYLLDDLQECHWTKDIVRGPIFRVDPARDQIAYYAAMPESVLESDHVAGRVMSSVFRFREDRPPRARSRRPSGPNLLAHHRHLLVVVDDALTRLTVTTDLFLDNGWHGVTVVLEDDRSRRWILRGSRYQVEQAVDQITYLLTP